MSRANARMKETHRRFAALVNRKVGARVAERRVLANLSQTDLGLPMGVSMQQAQRYEAGETGMDVATLLSIAKTLGCSAADLLVDFEPGAKGVPPAMSAEAAMIAKGVDGIKSGGLRGVVKILVDKLRAYERAIEKE